MADVPADSSPAAGDPDDALAALTPPELAEWRTSGNLPSSTADSTPAEPDDQAASTDALPPAASEPATRKGHKGNADTRVAELLTDRTRERERADRLERELAEIRRGTPDARPAASSPASPAPAKVADYQRYLALADAPKLAEFDTYEQWTAATALFVADQRHDERVAGERAEQQHRGVLEAQTKRVDTFVDAMNAAKDADPTFVTRISPEVGNLKTVAKALADGERLTVDHAIAEEIIDSPIPTDLLVHLSEHPTDLAELRQATDKADLKRRIGRLEGRLERDTPAPSPVNTVTRAPAPGRYLGNRGATADPVAAALRNNSDDAGDYIAAMNKRELTAAGKR